MPHPSRRLDLQLVPMGSDPGARVRRAFADLVAREVIREDGWAARGAGTLVERGFVRVRSDVGEVLKLWANQQGGFRAVCPTCGESVIAQLHQAIAQHAFGPLTCPGCGSDTPVADLDFRPPAAVGSAALVVHDVATAGLTEWGLAWADTALGPYKPILRRP